MSLSGRESMHQQEKKIFEEASSNMSLYEAEIIALNEELKKLKKRLEILEEGKKSVEYDLSEQYQKEDTTISREKTMSKQLPVTAYLLVDAANELIFGAKTLEKVKTIMKEESYLLTSHPRIIKVKEVYEANGDV